MQKGRKISKGKKQSGPRAGGKRRHNVGTTGGPKKKNSECRDMAVLILKNGSGVGGSPKGIVQGVRGANFFSQWCLGTKKEFAPLLKQQTIGKRAHGRTRTPVERPNSNNVKKPGGSYHKRHLNKLLPFKRGNDENRGRARLLKLTKE